MQDLTPAERRKLATTFAARLADLDCVQVYWLRSARRLTVRATVKLRRDLRPVPVDAVLIGTYAHPFSSVDFLGDLEDLLDHLAARENAPQAEQLAPA